MFIVFDKPKMKQVQSVPGGKQCCVGGASNDHKPAPSPRGARGSHTWVCFSEKVPAEEPGPASVSVPRPVQPGGVARDTHVCIRFVAPANQETTATTREDLRVTGALEAVGSQTSVLCPQADAEKPGFWKQVPLSSNSLSTICWLGGPGHLV